MPIETPQGNLDIKNATLRTSNLETQNIKIGSIFVGTGNSLEETANVGNSMSNTIQFTNTHTAFTTTGNVEVGGELTVSGNVSDLNVVSNVNLLHTSNTAALKLNSNVVTEFPRSKKLIKYPRVALTSAAQTESGYEGYFVSQDSATLNGVSNRQAWALFDTQGPGQGTGLASPHFDGSGARFDSSGNYTGGDSLGGISGDWVYIRLPDKIQLQSVALWARFGGLRNPIDATVLGSLNGTNWSVVGSWTGASFTSGKSTSFNLNSTQYYDYIGFVFEKIEAGSSGGYVNFHEIELFGTPEYDPEAHGVDVVVKSVPNVPNTDFLDVFVDAGNASGFTLSGSDVTGVTDLSTPANTMTVNGNVTYNSANKAFVFPGTTSSYMRATLVDGNGNYPLTLSVWFMMTDYNANSWRSIITVGTNGTGEQASIAYDPNQDQLYFGTYGADIYVPHTPELGKWNHVAATFTGGSTTSSTMNVYINGVNMGGVPNGTQTPSFTNNQFVIGGAMNSNGTTVNNPFKGQIANARFYRRAYTSDEIYQLYAYQKEYFGHGDLGMTLKAGRLGIGTSEPRAALDVRGDVNVGGLVNNVGMHWFISHSAGGNVAYTPTDGNWFSSTASSTVFGTVLRTENAAPVSAWNSSNGYFTAPEDGLYLIDLALFINGFDTGRWGGFKLLEADGTTKESQYTFYTANLANDDTVGYSKTVYMKAGESFAFYTTQGTVTLFLASGPPGHTTMNIYKIS